MLRVVVIAVGALLAFSDMCIADTTDYPSGVVFEQGAYPYHEEDNVRWTVRGAANVRPLRQMGDEAFRFTFDAGSALRMSYVYQARRFASGAVLYVSWLDRRSGGGWMVTRRQQFRLQRSEYDGLAAEIDEQLRRGRDDAERVRRGDEPMLCTDGFSLRTERIADGHESWMQNGCGPNDPNEAIDRTLRDFILDRIGS